MPVSSTRIGTKSPPTPSRCCAWMRVATLTTRSCRHWSANCRSGRWSSGPGGLNTTWNAAPREPRLTTIRSSATSPSNTRHSTRPATPIRSSSSTPPSPARTTKRRCASWPTGTTTNGATPPSTPDPDPLFSSGRRQLSELLQDGVQVRHPPVVGDLPVANSHRVDRFELNGLTGGGDAEQVAEVGAVVDLERRDDVAVDGLPQNLGLEVGERLAQPVVEQPHSGFVGGGAGLGRVVDEVVGEQFLECGEIAVALHLFGVAANHRLEGFGFAARGRRHLGGIWVGHCLPAFLSTLIGNTPRMLR